MAVATLARSAPLAAFQVRPRPRRRRLAIRFESWPIVWLWPAALLFMQVPLLRLESFEITVGVVVCHLLQLFLVARYWLHLPSTRQIVVYPCCSACSPPTRSSSCAAWRTSPTSS
jgi:hypothetical protein